MMKRQLPPWIVLWQSLGANCERSALELHTQITGVREIRELINSGRAFAVLTPISLIPQIARGCTEGDMDEVIAEKVNQMTKIVMASTADAWLEIAKTRA